jgi:hypothetical protein
MTVRCNGKNENTLFLKNLVDPIITQNQSNIITLAQACHFSIKRSRVAEFCLKKIIFKTYAQQKIVRCNIALEVKFINIHIMLHR